MREISATEGTVVGALGISVGVYKGKAGGMLTIDLLLRFFILQSCLITIEAFQIMNVGCRWDRSKRSILLGGVTRWGCMLLWGRVTL